MFSRVEKHLLIAGVVVYITRMLGLFMLLPVLAIYAADLPGASAFTLGLALGVYGLTQGAMQIPMGWISDRFGRRPVILAGLLLFSLGTLVAALATNMPVLILGRALQGFGAISSTLLALVGDSSREENRSKIMAVIGISIGFSFGLAMVFGPMIGAQGGLPVIFWTILGLCLLSLLVAWRWLPESKPSSRPQADVHWSEVLKNANLVRLDIGVLLLHCIQMSMWVAVPVMLVSKFELPVASHWWVYLVAVFGSFILMAPFMQWMEKRRRYRGMILSGVVAIFIAQLLLGRTGELPFFVAALFLFFWGFNLLEATLPSLTSKVVEGSRRGLAMGTFSTSQFIGAFLGGISGGWIGHTDNLENIFIAAAALALIWFFVALGLQQPKQIRSLVFRLDELREASQTELLSIAGVVTVQEFREQGEILLRLDDEHLDKSALEMYVGRTI